MSDLLDMLDTIETLDAAEGLHLGYIWPPPPHDEIITARDAWIAKHGNFGYLFKYHGWDQPWYDDAPAVLNGHNMRRYRAWLGCDHYRQNCACVGDRLYVAVCEPCNWYHPNPVDSENASVELWHDHAWPGWRDLPPVPERLQAPPDVSGARRWAPSTKWRAEQYGPAWDVPGAPVITERSGFGTRRVPGRSPNGGYDLANLFDTDKGGLA